MHIQRIGKNKPKQEVFLLQDRIYISSCLGVQHIELAGVLAIRLIGLLALHCALSYCLGRNDKRNRKIDSLVHNMLCFYKSILLGIWKAKEEVCK